MSGEAGWLCLQANIDEQSVHKASCDKAFVHSSSKILESFGLCATLHIYVHACTCMCLCACMYVCMCVLALALVSVMVSVSAVACKQLAFIMLRHAPVFFSSYKPLI